MDKWTLKLTLFISLLLILGCKKEPVAEEKQPLKNIFFGFETTLEDWANLGGGRESNAIDDIVISSDTMLQGNYSCKFTLSPNSVVAGGNRAELTFDQNAIEGDITWYEYSFFIPTDYQDVDLNDNQGLVNWQVIGQWHHQPVFSEGEDWNSYTGQNASPPIGIYYNYLDTADIHFQNLLQNPLSNTLFGFDPNWNNASTITVVYGENSIAIGEINKGEWVSLKFHIKWSENADGFIQVWKDETELTDGKVFGANMLNKASHYFKFGLYRNPTIPFTNYIYYDDIKIWND